MKNYIILKLTGLAMLTMIVLVLISILEVAVYSYLIHPGQEESEYEAHAQASAPYISGIFGFVIFFLVARYWTKKEYENVSRLIVLFPLVYVLLDIVILIVADVKWSDFILIFAMANTAKFLGSYSGYKFTSRQ